MKSNDTYDFVWFEDKSGTERLDIYKSIKEFDALDTSNCVAAYYRKTKELLLGNEELIKQILKARNLTSLLVSKRVDTFEIKDGKAYMYSSKEDKAIGMSWSCTLVNGYLDKEKYSTPDIIVEVLDVNHNTNIVIEPINLSWYTGYQLVHEALALDANDVEYYSLDYLKSLYDIGHIEDNDFVVVTSMEQARERLKMFRDAPTKIKAVDLETTGTDIGIYGEDVITGLSLSWNESESTYYPFRQEKCEFNLSITFLREILDVINNQPKDVKIVAYNAKFEIEGIWKESKYYIGNSEYAKKWDSQCQSNGLEDTYLRIDADPFFLSIICNPVFKQYGIHTLKTEAYNADGKFYLELGHIFKDKKNIKFNVLPPEIIRYYACPDTPNTIKVYKRLYGRMPSGTQGIFELENKMIYVTAENEFFGMRIKKDLLADLIANEEYKVEVLGNYFRQVHHTSKNINSPDVRRDIFYNKLRCPVEVRTNKGLPSTSNIALKRIIELGALREYDKTKEAKSIVDMNGNVVVKGEDLLKNKYPSLVILDKYAKAQKELGAYKRIFRTSKRNRVMFYINQYGAATGRRTSDAHQYSDGMKKLVVADSDDHYLWSSDFKQIELRLLAYQARQENLIKLESNKDIDVHRAITSIITGQPIWAISASERQKRKATNFGVVYMMSAYGLAKKNAGPAYTTEDYLAALKSINEFYLSLPNINQYVKGNETFVREKGYMVTALGRRRDFKEILDPSYSEKKKASMLRAANNMPIQGLGADLLKIVELNLRDYIKKKGWDTLVDCGGVMLPKVRLMLSIHDEVLVSTHKSIPIAEIITMFKVCMEVEIKGAPPFFAAPAKVENWFEGKLDKYELDLNFRDEIVEAYAKDKTELIHADTYLQELTEYRSRRLSMYMDDLIRKYVTAEEVAKHVRHDELTHTLISIFTSKEENLDHMTSILEATKRYMEKQKVDNKDIVKVSEEKTQDYLEDIAVLRSFEELEELVNFDENGEAIIEESEVIDDDLDTVTDNSAYLSPVERTRAIYSLNQVFIDLNEFNLADARLKNIYKELSSLFLVNGPYQVYLMIDGQIRSVGMFIEYVPTQIDNIINNVLRKEVFV